MQDVALWRILDANANRAAEGMRVVEEYWRFAVEDAALAAAWKDLRHALAAQVTRLDRGLRMAARDVAGDIGTSITGALENRRANLAEVLDANIERVQQALRALEEFGKVVDPDFAAGIERIRYQVYDAAKAGLSQVRASERLAGRNLYVLADGCASADVFEARARAVLAAQVDVIQLRDKRLDDRTLLERARKLRVWTREAGVLFIVNDRPDLVALADADGVHVGQQELAVADARRIVGPIKLVGVSTHNLAQIHQAVHDGADYIGCGPTFPSQTKAFEAFPGLEFLRQAATATRLPAFAIGGINAERLEEVLATGFTRIAVSGAVWNADNPTKAVHKLRRVFESANENARENR